MFSKQEGPVLVVRLQPGEEIVDSLRSVAERHQLLTATVLSGIGMLRDLELGYFRGPERGYQPHHLEQPCELLALTGNISRQAEGYHLHLHATVAGESGAVSGGHLVRAVICYTGEIFLLEVGIPVFRKADPNGMLGLYLE